MSEKNKKSLGQYFTVRHGYILKNMTIPKEVKTVVEPFAGNGDLIPFIKEHKKQIECYDIDPKKDFITKKDTLKNPPDYFLKYIVTNPPYLARNKSKSKFIFDFYNQNDLYKCFLQTLLNDEPLGGIIIIPLNFWCSIRKSDVQLRKNFLHKFNVIKMNIFEERVFDDTSYTVCCFQFDLRASGCLESDSKKINNIQCFIYPGGKETQIELSNENNYTIGGEIYSLPKSKYEIERATKNNKDSEYLTKITLKCLDDSVNSKICLYISQDSYIDDTRNLTARSYATLIIKPKLNDDEQEAIVRKFNEYINTMRKKYNSLFLTNYRESNSIARKRISFKLAFDIVSYLLINFHSEESNRK